MALSLAFVVGLHAQTPPDLTATGAIAALKADTHANPRYSETYNLGPTGLRGWIYVGQHGSDENGGADGTFSVLAVDDAFFYELAAHHFGDRRTLQ